MSTLVKLIGENIKAIRILKGLSRDALAEKCEIHITYLAAVERGERNITIESLEKISVGLDTTVKELMTFNNLKIDKESYHNKQEGLNILMNKVSSFNALEINTLIKMIDNVIEFKKL